MTRIELLRVTVNTQLGTLLFGIVKVLWKLADMSRNNRTINRAVWGLVWKLGAVRCRLRDHNMRIFKKLLA